MKYALVKFPINDELLTSQRALAERHEKRRNIRMICGGEEQPVQAFLNTFCGDSYPKPHRHPVVPETFECIDGEFGLILFNEDGGILSCYRLTEGEVYTVQPGRWHTVVCLKEFGTVYETKQTYYYPLADKSFAPWAPDERTADAVAYLARLKEHFKNA